MSGTLGNSKWIVVASSVHRWDDTRILYRQAASLSALGKVVLFAPAPFRRKKMGNITIIGIPPWHHKHQRIRLIASLYFTFRNNIKNVKSIHVHDPELLPLIYLLHRKNKHIGLIYDMHENYKELIYSKSWIPLFLRSAIKKIYVWVEEKVIPELSGVIYSPKELKNKLLSLNSRAVRIENYPILKRESAFPNLEEIKRGNNKVVYLGQMRRIRGIMELIEAIKVVSKTIENIRLEFIGRAVPLNFEWEIKTKIQQLNLESYISVRGHLPYDEALRLARDANIGIVTFLPTPNNISCLPNKLFEYMQLCLPVIGSNFPHYAEIIGKSNCGLLVDPSDPNSIALGIIKLLSDPDLLKKMGNNGRRAVDNEYNWENESNKLLNFYYETLSVNLL